MGKLNSCIEIWGNYEILWNGQKEQLKSGNVPCTLLGYHGVCFFYACGNYIKISNTNYSWL